MAAEEEQEAGDRRCTPLRPRGPLELTAPRQPGEEDQRTPRASDEDDEGGRHDEHRIPDREEGRAPEEVDRGEGGDQRQASRSGVTHRASGCMSTTSKCVTCSSRATR